ncbi:MAG: amidohydrolase family protein [Rikenellaceae bacterium]
MSCSTPNRKIASNLLLREGELIPNPVVEVDGSGRIVSIESRPTASMDSSVCTEFYSGIIMAGFVNAHCHIELSYLRGAIESGGGFQRFASSIGAVRNNFSDEEREVAMRRADAELFREGVVAVGDIANGLSSFEIKRESKILYHTFAELFGLRSVDLEAVAPLLDYPNTSPTPHSLYSLNDKAFRRVVEQSGDAPLSIHFMESPSEAELFRGEGPLLQWYQKVGFECDFLHYGSPAERLVSLVPSDRSVMLIHNCCLTQRDIDTVMGHFSAPVTWVICPRSNRYISSLTPPVELLRKNGLQVAIGTDSLASNWSLSILEELRELSGVPLVERLDWATRWGAAALGISELGDIEVGRRPAINILSGINYERMELTPSSKIKQIIY